MPTIWFRPITPPTWHVVCSWPDGRRSIVAVERSQREAALRMRRSASRLLDVDPGNLGSRATARGIALCGQELVHAALTVEPCEVERCSACAGRTGGAR